MGSPFREPLCHSGTACLKWPMQIVTLSLRSKYQLAHVYKFSPSLHLFFLHSLLGPSLSERATIQEAGVIFQLFELFAVFLVYFSSGATEWCTWNFAIGQWGSHAGILSADYSMRRFLQFMSNWIFLKVCVIAKSLGTVWMVAYFVKKLELNSSIICDNKYRDEVHELFLCSL